MGVIALEEAKDVWSWADSAIRKPPSKVCARGCAHHT